MEKEYSLEELINLTDEKIELGEKLIKDLSSLEKIDGVPKLQRKINQELKFFKKVNLKAPFPLPNKINKLFNSRQKQPNQFK